MTWNATIVGTGLGVPSKVVTNKDFEKMVDTSDEWIRTRTGICERRFIDRDKGETLETIALQAGKKALENAKTKPEDIDLIIFATTSPDTFMPNMSCRMTASLGLVNAAAIDQNAACSGFVLGMHTADSFIRSGQYKNIMVIGGEALSSALDMKDRSTCVLFGDGAGAAIVQAVENADLSKDSVILGSKFYAKADVKESLSMAGGGTRTPYWHEDFAKVGPYIRMQGQDVFKEATRGMVRAAKEVMAQCEVMPSDIKWFVPHQANLRIIEMVGKMLEIPSEKTYINLDRWGNTSAATVITCLAEMEEKNMINKGDLVLMDVFGGGFSYGALLARW
ncbi:ketoacyl-ACP synthase III [bacterium]|nr:ketoacyl-ACP synthase III [bacterium]